MPKSRTVTITNQIRVLRSGGPWKSAIFMGTVYGLTPLIAQIQIIYNLPVVLIFLPVMWFIQWTLGQNSAWGYTYDLKITNPRKTFLFHTFFLIIFLILLYCFIHTIPHAATLGLICIICALAFTLMIHYLMPWVYKEPRSEHFPAMAAEL